MDKEELKKKVLDWQALCQKEKRLNRTQFKLDRIKNKVREEKNMIFSNLEGFLENLLEGKEVAGKNVFFTMEDYRKSWWIHNFEIDGDKLALDIGYSNNEEPVFYRAIYDLDRNEMLSCERTF